MFIDVTWILCLLAEVVEYLFAGVIVLLSLAFLMPAFYYIPKASLAAVIICAVAPMLDFSVVANMWRIRSMFAPLLTQV